MFNPRYVYHASNPARIVESQEDYDALGPGWAESPHAAAILADTQAAAEVDQARAALTASIEAQVKEAEEKQRTNIAAVLDGEQKQAEVVRQVEAGEATVSTDGALVLKAPPEVAEPEAAK